MSRRIDVLLAIAALIAATRPQADVRGLFNDDARPDEVGPGGMAVVRSGDPGEPSVDLSPPTYWWDHTVPAELAAYAAGGQTSRQVLDDWLVAIGQAVVADRTLGGLCSYLDVSAPIDGEVTAPGAVALGWADFTITASYETSSPLG